MSEKDIISKALIEQLASCLVTQLLKLSVVPDSIEWLSPEYQRVEDRRADLVVRMKTAETAPPCLLHLEIQNSNDSTMPLRMLRYYTDIRFRWQRDPVKQYVIYTGKDKLAMAAGIDEDDITYRYEIIDMRTIDCALLLAEDTPEALVLAILCDFKGRKVQNIVGHIVTRLHQLTGEDSQALRRYVHMLEVLSENRNLKHVVEETEQMLTDFKIEQLPSYKIAMQRGEVLGLQRGEAIGAQKAQAKAHRDRIGFATQLIGNFPDQQIADMFELPLSEVAALHHQNGSGERLAQSH